MPAGEKLRVIGAITMRFRKVSRPIVSGLNSAALAAVATFVSAASLTVILSLPHVGGSPDVVRLP
jgi:hypothetical protein